MLDGESLPLVPGASSSLAPGGDSSHHAMMSAAMLDAKKARMKVERDREMLANRIARLQAEELRAVKRIETTHRRTKEILDAKNRHRAQQAEKNSIRSENEEAIEAHRQELVKVREERKAMMQAVKQGQEMSRQEQVRYNKTQHSRNKEAIEAAKAAELNFAMLKRNEVRKVEADARERKLREKEVMIAHLQQRAEDRQLMETRRAGNLEAQLQSLEKQEFDLLLALEGHRNERQDVYRELESQLGHAPAALKGRSAGSSMPGMA